MNWYKCIAFCNELTKQAGLGESECLYYSDAGYTKVYTKEDAGAKKEVYLYTAMNKKGFRLPTEAEWEWAARSGENYQYAGSDNIDEVAWYSSNTSDTGTRDVKTKKANGCKLYDMNGNVWEWCWDWYASVTNTTPNTGASSGSCRCCRGGSWNGDASDAGVALRGFSSPYNRYDSLDFRLVRNAN